MCSTTHEIFNKHVILSKTRELLQFCRDEKIRNFGAPGNDEDNFVDIIGVITK